LSSFHSNQGFFDSKKGLRFLHIFGTC
jgi:hypothetical protein